MNKFFCCTLFLCLLMFTACSNGPVLKATNEESYKTSLKDVFDSLKTDAERMDFAKAISYVALDGKEEKLDSPEIAYDFYKVLAFVGRTGQLMPLHEKSIPEIIVLGQESRKKWVLANMPKEIENLEERVHKIKKNVENQLLAQETEDAFIFDTILLEPSKVDGNNVKEMLLTFMVHNKGKLPVTTLNFDMKVIDNETGKEIASGVISAYSSTSFSPKESKILAPGASEKVEQKITFWGKVENQTERYTPQVKIKHFTAEDPENTSSFFLGSDAKNLVEYEQRLDSYKQELQKFSK